MAPIRPRRARGQAEIKDRPTVAPDRPPQSESDGPAAYRSSGPVRGGENRQPLRSAIREFASPADFNAQLGGWVATVNTRWRRRLECAPADRIGADKPVSRL
jgi:hypothetical protein